MASRYEILEKVGEGAAGTVFRARAPGNTLVAVKLLKKLESQDAVARFEREQRLLRQLGELEGFVPLLDAGAGASGPWLVMPFLAGGTLRDRLGKKPRFAVAEAVGICGRLAASMGRAHARGLVHRDLKPENVLFAPNGRPLIADLGLAKHFRRDLKGGSLSLQLSRPGEFAGTPGYMAPEQMLSSTDAKPTADVFSLGSILYECLAWRYAFPGESFAEVVASVQGRAIVPLAQLCPECPDELVAIVERALAEDPAARFPDASALARALAACPLVRLPSGTRPVLVDSAIRDTKVTSSTVEDSRPTGASVFEWAEPEAARPRALWLALGAGALLVALGVVAVAGKKLARERQAEAERARVEAAVHEVRRLAQAARTQAETPGPQSLASAGQSLAAFAELPPAARDRALEAETREAVAWGQLARGDDGLAIAAATSALALVAPDAPAAGTLRLLRARALLRSARTEDALADLAGLTSLEARRLRAQSLVALRRWAEVRDLAGSDDFLGAARAWARFRLAPSAAAAREDAKALGPAGRELLGTALRLAEARDRLVAVPVPGDFAEVHNHAGRSLEVVESFANALLGAWRSSHRALLDRSEDAGALVHALGLLVAHAKTFVDFDASRTNAVAEHLDEAAALVLLEGSPERAAGSIWLAQLHESLLFFDSRLDPLERERRREAQAGRIDAIAALPGPFSPDVEYARRRTIAVDTERRARTRRASQADVVVALERVLDATPRGASVFGDAPFVEAIWRWSLCSAACRAAAALDASPERERLLSVAQSQIRYLRERAIDPESRRDVNMVEFLVALVRGDDARAEEIARFFNLEPRADAPPSDLGRCANELFLAGELRRRQGRLREAEPLLERAVKLRSVNANNEGPVEGTFVFEPILAHGLLLAKDPARRAEGIARLQRVVSNESSIGPVLPWLEAETHAVLGK